jgi:hypothetical protein
LSQISKKKNRDKKFFEPKRLETWCTHAHVLVPTCKVSSLPT